MVESDYYEIVRQKLTLGPLKSPKHKKIIELMKVFWTEEEIKILVHFESADKSIPLKKLAEKTGIPKQELKQKLSRLVKVGTIHNIGLKYALEPLLPGVFEKYFQRRTDTEENQLKAAKLYRDIMKEVMPSEHYESGFKLFRPLLPLEAQDKLIEINKKCKQDLHDLDLDYSSQIKKIRAGKKVEIEAIKQKAKDDAQKADEKLAKEKEDHKEKRFRLESKIAQLIEINSKFES